MANERKKRILFVDDEKMFLVSVERILRHQMNVWQIDYAERAAEALAALEESDYDVLVTDINMPAMTGFELLEELRKQPRLQDLPVIVLTGNSQDDLKRRALELGATDLLSKPVHPEDLIARLRSALRTKDYQDQIKAYNRSLEDMVKERTAALEASRREIIWRLAKAGEYRDEDTGNHVVRVGCYCRSIAEKLNMPDHFVDAIFLAGPLHDIGKIGIPDRILLKPARLTDEERNIMEGHCAIGAKILSDIPLGLQHYNIWRESNQKACAFSDKNEFLEMAVGIAQAHHEKWDGSGYPQKLGGEDIPLEARIVALADVYDALISKRPYKKAFDEKTVMEIIRAEVSGHFDPTVYEAFLACLDDIRAVRDGLSDEEIRNCP